MLAQYGENSFMQRNVYQWVGRLQSGRTSVIDEDRSGCPTTSQTVGSVEQLIALVQENR
jgi:hypothetical protein